MYVVYFNLHSNREKVMFCMLKTHIVAILFSPH